MQTLYLALAIIIPWTFGSLWLRWLVRPAGPGQRALVAGYGLLLGLLGATLVMRLGVPLGLPLSPVALSLVLAVIAMFPARAIWRRATQPGNAPDRQPGASPLEKCAIAAVAVLVLTHGALLLPDVLLRPIYPFDATSAWVTKARVWFDQGSLAPFVAKELWLQAREPLWFTDHMPDYPITTPLLQLWMALFVGHWDSSLINLPWFFCLIALALMFYGQLRRAQLSALAALVFVYFLVSMPLLETHVALAGYADLFMGTFYAAAFMAFCRWCADRDPAQACLALLFALACPLIKNEGLFWACSFIPGVIIATQPRRRALVILLLLALAALGLLQVLPQDLEIAGHTLERLDLGYRDEVLPSILRSFAGFDNWHLFIYLLALLLIAACVLLRQVPRDLVAPGIALLAASGLFLLLFTYTGYAGGATRFTAVSRTSMALVPAWLFFAALLYRAIQRAPPTTGDTGH
ncbi:hypothetical protein [Parahaliea aestuarii]|uniref:Glycosyltransferase RgtA/B/C/D-like domain-containing protein n=1 Tax=Parahaliea aestuarii TaxID=1852021 RepID=A0A5C8ZNK6_9GAMM|nr:hypothetical protein [Parahaliea aestuarii]TXS89332.1 hypothetical protein FVW59_17595 [Parahaliea aestuarii]